MTKFEVIERKIIFGKMDTRTAAPYKPMSFRIEPPIQVHDPSFLSHAVKQTIDENATKYLVGRKMYEHRERLLRYPIIKDVTLSFSDEIATYGAASVHSHVEYMPLVGLITTSFEKALNPIGRVALEFHSSPDCFDETLDRQFALERSS